jgi:hypothetical protein
MTSGYCKTILTAVKNRGYYTTDNQEALHSSRGFFAEQSAKVDN